MNQTDDKLAIGKTSFSIKRWKAKLTNRTKIVFYILFITLVFMIFGLIMAHEFKQGDFPQHIAWAKEYADTGYLYKIPHTLFSKLVIIIRTLLPANILVRVSVLAKQVFDLKSFEISTWILMVLSYIATALILVKRIFQEWSGVMSKSAFWMAGTAVLVIMLVGPIFIFTFPERMYMGYIVPNPYHNPTYVLFRPFVLLVFTGIVDNLFTKWNWRQGLIVTLMIVCASLAKPNFTITILPALGLLILIFYIKKIKSINWFYVIGAVGLTTIIVLVSQYIINYTGDRGDQIIVAPFKALLTEVPNVPTLLFFTILSMVFPVVVSIFYWKSISTGLSFRLAWVNFLIGLVYSFVLAEKFNLTSGNFGWSSMIGLFILFFVTIIKWGKELLNRNNLNTKLTWKDIVVASTLFVHLICGIIYYVICLQTLGSLVG